MKTKLLHGDCLETLKDLAENSVDSLVTDPPAGISFMGKDWDSSKGGRDSWIAWMSEVMRECMRVMKPGAHGLVWAIPRTSHWTATALENAGFEVRDVITHHFGSGFPKSSDISKQLDKQAQVKWLKLSETLAAVDLCGISRTWIKYLKLAQSAETFSRRSRIEAGGNTTENSIALEIVLPLASLKKLNVNAIIVDLTSLEVPHTPEVKTNFSVLSSAGENTMTLSIPAWSVKRLFESQNHRPSTTDSIVQCNAKVTRSENLKDLTKAEEALKTWLGSKQSSNREITDALCAALTESLKLTILNQSKTFQSLDMNSQMDCVSAISVTITESTAESLISSTVATLKSKAIDQAAGAKREVIGENPNNRPNSMTGKDREAGIQYKICQYQPLTAPATDAAKQWQGFGTALKPASEHWILVRKHSEKDLISDIYDECLKIVQYVENNLLPTLHESNAEKGLHALINVDLSAAQESAEKTLVDGKAESGNAPMDISPLGRDEILSFLSIVLSWKSFLEENYTALNTCITEMGLKTITELKTLKSCLSQIMQSITSQNPVSEPQMFLAAVGNAEKNFAGLFLQIKSLNDISVHGPASEHVLLIRKPCSEKTVAQNVLKYGCGGLNIDGCRVGSEVRMNTQKDTSAWHGNNWSGSPQKSNGETKQVTGRFPANLLLSHSLFCKRVGEKKVKAIKGGNSTNVSNEVYGKYNSDLDRKPCGFGDSDGTETVEDWNCTEDCPVRLLDLQSGLLKSGARKPTTNAEGNGWKNSCKDTLNSFQADTGGASRFFKTFEPTRFAYVAKASKRERNAGLDSSELIQLTTDLCKEDNTALAALLQKVTSESMVRWSTVESGKAIMVIFPKGCKSTIETEISRIIESKILNSLHHSLTSENTQGVSLLTDDGLNHAANVASLKKWILSTTNEKTASALGVVSAALQMLWSIKDAEGKPLSNIHSTVKSQKLMQYLITLVTPPNGVVLDPFAGSGSTGVAAKSLGFSFVGIEREKEYFEIAVRRIKNA